MAAYSLDEEEFDGIRVVAVSGDLDMGAAPAFEQRLVGAVSGDDRVILDLTGVTFMDSTAIGALISARKAAGMSRGRFALVCKPGDIRRMLEYTGLDSAFDVEETREAAVAKLEAG